MAASPAPDSVTLSQENKAENDTAGLMVSYSRLFMYALGLVYLCSHMPVNPPHTYTYLQTQSPLSLNMECSLVLP